MQVLVFLGCIFAASYAMHLLVISGVYEAWIKECDWWIEFLKGQS